SGARPARTPRHAQGGDPSGRRAGPGRGGIGGGRVPRRAGRLGVPDGAGQHRPARDDPATRIRRGGVMPHDSAFSIPSGRRTAQTLIVYVEDQPGTLNRIVSLFRRRGFNIESLTVGRSEREGISRITVLVRTGAVAMQRGPGGGAQDEAYGSDDGVAA